VKAGGKGPALPTWSFPPRRLSLFGEPSGLVECPTQVINHLRTPGTGRGAARTPGTSEVGGRGGNGRRQRRPRPRGRPTTAGGEPQRRVSVEPAPTAAVCGAMGCRRDEKLLKVCRSDGETRVLCFRHTVGWCL
jgi:hypothetical protein